MSFWRHDYFWPVVLIVVGVYFLLRNTGWLDWPQRRHSLAVLLIVPRGLAHRPPFTRHLTTMRMRYRSFFWPVALILAGVIALLVDLMWSRPIASIGWQTCGRCPDCDRP